jgi:hypothetical protein
VVFLLAAFFRVVFLRVAFLRRTAMVPLHR